MDWKCKVKEFFESDWTMSEKVLFTASAVLLGVLVGFLFSPFKGGVKVLSDLGAHNTQLGYMDDEDEE